MDKIKKALHTLELANLVGEDIQKARVTKYYRREGGPGNYKYYYTKAEYDKAKGVKKEEATPKNKANTEKINWIEEWLDNDTGAVVAEKHSGDYIGNEGLNKMKNEYDKLYSDLASKKAKASKETREWENRDHRYKNKVDVLRSEVKEREEEIRQINSEMEANAPEGGGGDEYAEEWTKRLGNLHEELKEVQEELEEAKKDFGDHEDKYPSMDESLLDEIESDEKKLFEMERVISEQDKLRKVARVKDMLTDLVNDPPEGVYEDVADTFGEPDDDGESESALIERIMSGTPLSVVEEVYEQNSKFKKQEKSGSELKQGFSPNQLEDYIYDNEDKIRDNFKSYGWSGKDVDNLKKNYIDLANVLGVDSRVVKDIDHSYAVDMLKDILDLRKAEYLGALQELGLDIGRK